MSIGKVFVHWDNGVRTLSNCGPEKFEVLPADDKQDQCDVDDDVRIGHKVRRGICYFYFLSYPVICFKHAFSLIHLHVYYKNI